MPWVHKAKDLPREEFKREVQRHLTGKETEAWEILYFKVYKSQLAVVEKAIEIVALMLGTDKSRAVLVTLLAFPGLLPALVSPYSREFRTQLGHDFPSADHLHSRERQRHEALASNGTAVPTLPSPSRAYQLLMDKTVTKTAFRLTLKHVTNSQELGKIDPATGLQECRPVAEPFPDAFGAAHVLPRLAICVDSQADARANDSLGPSFWKLLGSSGIRAFCTCPEVAI